MMIIAWLLLEVVVLCGGGDVKYWFTLGVPHAAHVTVRMVSIYLFFIEVTLVYNIM